MTGLRARRATLSGGAPMEGDTLPVTPEEEETAENIDYSISPATVQRTGSGSARSRSRQDDKSTVLMERNIEMNSKTGISQPQAASNNSSLCQLGSFSSPIPVSICTTRVWGAPPPTVFRGPWCVKKPHQSPGRELLKSIEPSLLTLANLNLQDVGSEPHLNGRAHDGGRPAYAAASRNVSRFPQRVLSVSPRPVRGPRRRHRYDGHGLARARVARWRVRSLAEPDRAVRVCLPDFLWKWSGVADGVLLTAAWRVQLIAF